MPEFIYTITGNEVGTIPIINNNSSFSDLSYNIDWNGAVNTVTITWSGFTRNSDNDGLSFDDYNVGNNVNIIAFGNIPLTCVGAQFRGMQGSITAIDSPDCSGSM